MSQGGRRAAFHSKGAAWGRPAPDPRHLRWKSRWPVPGGSPRQPHGDSRGSLGSSASCPGHSAGSVAPAPSQFLEQTEVSTTDLRQPAQSAMGAPRTVRGGRVSASGGVGVRTSRPRRLCHGPGLARAEDRSAGTARHPRAAAGGQEIAPQTWEGAPVCVSPSRTGGQGGTCTQEPPVELGRHAPLLSPPHQTKVWSEPGADVRGGSGPALSTGRGRPTPEASPRVPAPMHKSETGTRNTYDNTIQIFTHNSQKHKHRGSTGEAPAGPWGGLWWHRLTSARPAQDTFGR